MTKEVVMVDSEDVSRSSALVGEAISSEVEGRDLTEDQIVHNWLQNTIDDCQKKLEQRNKQIALFKRLLASKQLYTQYHTLELQWEEKQTRLIQINQEISAAEQQTLQIEEETRNALLVQQGLSALLAHTIDWNNSANDDILKHSFQYLAETANAHQFMLHIDDCFQIIRQQGLPSPPKGQLLQEAVQLQEMLPAYKNIWVQSKQRISQVEEAIAALDKIEQQRQTGEHSLQNIKNLLARFPTQIEQAQIVLQKQQVVTQTFENAMMLLRASKPESLASIFQQFLDSEVTAQLATQGPLNSLNKEKILPKELLAAGRLDTSIEFVNIWNVANTVIQERVRKALVEVDAYRQASTKFSSLKETFTEHWKNLPAVTNGLILERYVSPSQQNVHYDLLIKRIEQNLSIIFQFRMRSFDASSPIFQNYNKHQMQKLLLETRALFFAADESLKHTLASIQTSNATCTTTAAHNFLAALNYWLTKKLQAAAQQAALRKKESIEGERQQLQQARVNEEAQLTRLLQTRTHYENQLNDAFYRLGQSAGISEALRQVAQQNATPQTIPLTHATTTQHKAEFVPAYHLCCQQWQSETERLEMLIEDLWKTLEGLNETIEQHLSQLHELREQQKQSLQDLSTQRDALQVMNPLALQNGRAWWHTFWAKIPEDVRLPVPAEGIYAHAYLEAVRAQFAFWAQELAREELVARQPELLWKPIAIHALHDAVSDKLSIQAQNEDRLMPQISQWVEKRLQEQNISLPMLFGVSEEDIAQKEAEKVDNDPVVEANIGKIRRRVTSELPLQMEGQKPAQSTETAVQLRDVEIRPAFLKALEEAQEQIIIYSPWVNEQVVDDEFVSLLETLVKKGVHILIGHGIGQKEQWEERPIPPALQQRLRAIHTIEGTPGIITEWLGNSHAKEVIIDRKIHFSGSHNWLSYRGDRLPRGETVYQVTIVSEVEKAYNHLARRFLQRAQTLWAQDTVEECIRALCIDWYLGYELEALLRILHDGRYRYTPFWLTLARQAIYQEHAERLLIPLQMLIKFAVPNLQHPGIIELIKELKNVLKLMKRKNNPVFLQFIGDNQVDLQQLGINF